jgi:hypothetical protein
MARMIPELTKDQLRELPSKAEANFYVACRDHLPNDILVIHSAGWVYRDAGGRIREGEADFTLASPSTGILAVEVKGGGVKFDSLTKRWSSVDGNGACHEIKDPFRQASNERHAIIDQLTGHPTWRQWKGKRFTIGHAVMLTNIDETKPLESPDRPKEIIGIGSDLGAMPAWFNRVMSFWRQKDDDPLGSSGVRLLEEVLCKSVAVRPVLRTTIDAAERERIQLTAKQAKILRIIGGRKRAVISGGAGTGKTLIAVEKARQLMQTGGNVLFLCYNRPLADALASSIPSQDKLHVMTFHQLCEHRVALARNQSKSDLFAEAEAAYPGDSLKHRFDVQYPYALALSNETLTEKYDAIVVDEAQDFSDEYWFAIEELLRDPKSGHLYIFIDQNQTLYKRHGNLPIDEEAFSLAANCRNTEPIHQAGYAYYKGEPVDSPELPGPPVIKSSFEDDARQAGAVAHRVRQWITEEKLDPEQITVLVAKQPKAALYELLSQQALPGSVSWAFEEHGRRRTVLVDTVKRFKGLEAEAVVLWVGDEVTDEEQWETLYVGTTRAKSLLCIVGSKRVFASMKALYQ